MESNKRKTGDWGEAVALDFLLKKEYNLIIKNYQYSKIGEIDIILETPDQKTVVFVEVKAGSPIPYGPLEYWITPRKQKTIYKIAEAFIQNYQIEGKDFRFDAMIIEGNKSNYKIKHMENAF
ncbi:MAG: YraN family protein [Calditrichia bacterium]|nr:YraN family protein [Calditrichia bacterium]